VLRKRQRYESVTLDEEPTEALVSTLHQENIQPEDAAHWVLLMIEVQDVIDKLPESQRQALIMYAEEGLSYGEIAEIMGCSLGTIKSRLFYAKRTLRQRLHPDTLAALESSFDAEHGDDE
jgi:RNA polymerase sigma-70 factor (ECF subfamily)